MVDGSVQIDIPFLLNNLDLQTVTINAFKGLLYLDPSKPGCDYTLIQKYLLVADN